MTDQDIEYDFLVGHLALLLLALALALALAPQITFARRELFLRDADAVRVPFVVVLA